MRTAEDFERVIIEHAAAMAAQNIGYAEISLNPSLHEGDGWIDGVVRGRRRVVRELGIEIAWLIELVRDESQHAVARDCPRGRRRGGTWARRRRVGPLRTTGSSD